MRTSEQIHDLAAALSKAQAKIKGASKDSANPYFKSRYADLASVWDACREALTEQGLSVSQWPSADGAAVTVETILAHESGQFISGTLTMTAKDDTPQSIGSCVTYARRYSLAAAVGVAPEDDDGEAAQPRGDAPRQQRQTAPPPAQAPPADDPPDNAESAKMLASALDSIEKADTPERLEEIVAKVNARRKWLKPDKVKAVGEVYSKWIKLVMANPSLEGGCRIAIDGDKTLSEPTKQMFKTQLQGAVMTANEADQMEAFG